jgi:hypothetical protein
MLMKTWWLLFTALFINHYAIAEYATCGGGPICCRARPPLTNPSASSEKFNEDNPDLQLNEFRAIDSPGDTEPDPRRQQN